MNQARELDLPSRDDISRILVLKWSAMGDVALASAAFEDIYQAFPGRDIDLDTLPPWNQLYADDPRFRQVQALGLRRKGKRLREGWRWLRQVAAARYDLVVDLQTTDRSRFMIAAVALFGRPITYRLGNKPAFPYNVSPARTMAPRHALTIAQDTLGAGKIRCITDRPILHPTEAQQNRSTQLCRQHGLGAKQFAVLLPGCQAAGYLKRWGTQRYAALADRLLREGHVEKVALLGGPDEMDDCSAIAARATIDGVVNLCGQTELLEVTAICRSASVVVGNDTGTGHLASAGDTPLIIICGPTDPRRVKPAGPQVHTMQADLPCINCYRKHCAHHSCMHLLTPTVVADVVVQRLRSNGSAEVL